ncbi:MAG: enoyl-CoA hydratase/isomerase family protein [Thermodesulfobacteriota bacterium]
MKNVLIEKRKNVAEIILNRPDKLNALSTEMYLELIEAFNLIENDEEIRVVILSGNGRAFCAGYDLSQEKIREPDSLRKFYETCNKARWMIWDSKKPIIAKTHGYCIGAGAHLALTCDFTYASEDACFGESEIKFGEISQFVLVPWLIGMKNAKKYLISGEMINAREAERIGLITRMVSAEELDNVVETAARSLAKMPVLGLRLTKMCINKVYEMQGFKNAMDFDLVAAVLSGVYEPAELIEFNHILKEKGPKAAFAYRDSQFI